MHIRTKYAVTIFRTLGCRYCCRHFKEPMTEHRAFLNVDPISSSFWGWTFLYLDPTEKKESEKNSTKLKKKRKERKCIASRRNSTVVSKMAASVVWRIAFGHCFAFYGRVGEEHFKVNRHSEKKLRQRERKRRALGSVVRQARETGIQTAASEQQKKQAGRLFTPKICI